MQEDFTQNRLHPGISRFETCEVWVRLFNCVSVNLQDIVHRGSTLTTEKTFRTS